MRHNKKRRPRLRQIPLFPDWERDPDDQPKKMKDSDFIPEEIIPGMPPAPPKGKQNG